MAKLNGNGGDELTTVYKKSGETLQVNSDMLPHLDSLNLSKEKPKQAAQNKQPKAKCKGQGKTVI